MECLGGKAVIGHCWHGVHVELGCSIPQCEAVQVYIIACELQSLRGLTRLSSVSKIQMIIDKTMSQRKS